MQSYQSTGSVIWRSCDIQTPDCEFEHQDTDSWCDGSDQFDGSGVNVDDFLDNQDMETSDSKNNTPNLMRLFSALPDQIVGVPLRKSRQSGRGCCSQRSGQCAVGLGMQEGQVVTDVNRPSGYHLGSKGAQPIDVDSGKGTGSFKSTAEGKPMRHSNLKAGS